MEDVVKSKSQRQSRPTNDIHSSKAMKRLFSQSHDETVKSKVAASDGESPEDDGSHQPAVKRQRSGEWPLPSSSNVAPSREAINPRTILPNASKHPRRQSSMAPNKLAHKRTSSFIEGSMNDRVSLPPPAMYTGYDEYMDKYEASSQVFDRSDSGHFVGHETEAPQPSPTAQASDQKPPMRRFGKNMFSAFNPSTWKLFSRSSKEPKVEKEPEPVLEKEPERNQITEQVYQQHKALGTFKAHTNGSVRFPRPSQFKRPSPTVESPEKDDSGAGYPSLQSTASVRESSRPPTSKAEKRFSRVYESDVDDEDDRPVSRMSEDCDRIKKRRSSFSLKRFGSERHSASTSDLQRPEPNKLRKMPSRDQIAKEQKMVKKLSDLQAKIAEHRRKYGAAVLEADDFLSRDQPEPLAMTTMEQINKTLSQRAPVEFSAKPQRASRGGFFRGTLATLPSERLISDYAVQDDEEQHGEMIPSNRTIAAGVVGTIAEAVTESESVGGTDVDIAMQMNQELSQAVARESELQAQNERRTPNVEPVEPSGDDLPFLQAQNERRTPRIEPVEPSSDDLPMLQAPTPTADDTSGDMAIAEQRVFSNESTGTVIHRRFSLARTEDQGSQVPKEQAKSTRKISAKRKSYADDSDVSEYKPESNEPDDDEEWKEAVKDTLNEDIRKSNKKQKIAAASSSPSVRKSAEKKKSFDSPRGNLINSTKLPNRASPKAPSFTNSPKAAFVGNTQYSKRTSVTPDKEVKVIRKYIRPGRPESPAEAARARKSAVGTRPQAQPTSKDGQQKSTFNQFPAPPSSSFDFESSTKPGRPKQSQTQSANSYSLLRGFNGDDPFVSHHETVLGGKQQGGLPRSSLPAEAKPSTSGLSETASSTKGAKFDQYHTQNGRDYSKIHEGAGPLPPITPENDWILGGFKSRASLPASAKSASTSGPKDTAKKPSPQVQTRPSSPMPKKKTNEFGDSSSIPPVPKLSEEMLKKHRESIKNPMMAAKLKKLTEEDIKKAQKKPISIHSSTDEDVKKGGQKKPISLDSSTNSEQDVGESVVKAGNSKKAESGGVRKKPGDDFVWDDDVF